MKIAHGKVYLTWENGRTVSIGTIDIDADQKTFHTTCQYRQRLGWELVRKGFALMFPGRKFENNYDPSEERQEQT